MQKQARLRQSGWNAKLQGARPVRPRTLVKDTQTIAMHKRDEFSRGGGIDNDLGDADASAVEPGESLVGEREPDASADAALNATGAVAALREELAGQNDKYLRLAAEFDNFRKRSNRERAEAGIKGQASLLRKLLEVIDDLDRFSVVDPNSTDTGTVVEGVVMICSKLHKELEQAGLEWISPEGQPFDPNLHEAMAAEPASAPDQDGVVARVYQRGYVFHGELLRPARVVVWQFNS